MVDAASESHALPGSVGALYRSLHVAAPARQRYSFPVAAFGLAGRVLNVDHDAALRITTAINEERDLVTRPADRVQPGSLAAAVILHELMHAVMVVHAMGHVALGGLQGAVGVAEADGSLGLFLERFPPPAVVDGSSSPAAYVTAASGDNRVAACEEVVIHSLALENRAMAPLAVLFELGPLASEPRYRVAKDALLAALARTAAPAGSPAAGSPAAGSGSRDNARDAGDAGRFGSLLDLLAEPQRRHPDSLFDQLNAALELWGAALSGRYDWLLTRALRGLDALREERPPGPHVSGPPPRSRGWAAGAEESGAAAYSSDHDWMPHVAMVAKNAFVWLAQLSARHGSSIERLDQVPAAALDDLAADGFNALWLVGVWRRSPASKTIKRLRGQPFAEASAYAIDEYVVADELGGEAALDALRDAAWQRGIRLASDMVPNHTGLDSRWVVEHPERFVHLSEPPFPGYTFTGPDVAVDERVQVRIEDGYYDGTDAAVVYQVRDAASGTVRYLYHGNDGTLMPWNDTAQLDYLRADVREAVIETIVAVAQRFPIIRFDAAMTLVRRHVRRLWHPAPGEGGAIPSRSRHALSREEFDAAMPREFWREVVEVVAARVPGTLLLAEAFWLMESYFVRTLGMHRVYNSAFMHMLASEDNAGYLELVRETLAFDPRILERFVNYLTNPDEESARERFGDADKYFGTATVLATLPGLPLFGHGQVEGMSEKYGMEFRAPRLHEAPDGRLVERHRREIAPLLRDRAAFASSARLRLVHVLSAHDDGRALPDVIAYGFADDGSGASLVVFNNAPVAASGRAYTCAPYALVEPDGSTTLTPALPLVEALGLGGAATGVVGELHPQASAVRFDVDSLRRYGLQLDLGPYEYRVYRHLRAAAAEERVSKDVGGAQAAPRTRRSRQGAVLAGPYGAAARRAAARRRN